MEIKFKSVGTGQIKPMPNGDWCDLCAAERVEMKPGSSRLSPRAWRCSCQRDARPMCFPVAPRSRSGGF